MQILAAGPQGRRLAKVSSQAPSRTAIRRALGAIRAKKRKEESWKRLGALCAKKGRRRPLNCRSSPKYRGES